MNLHRSGSKPEWEGVDPERRNIFQRIAAKTRGILTPANVVTVAGAGLVASGLMDIYSGHMYRGVAKICVGRTADLVDGAIADKTGTKSPAGEVLDVVTDKAEMAAALPALVASDILPVAAGGLILAQNIAVSALSVYAKRKGRILHPSKEGKLTTFGQWATIGFYALAAVTREIGYGNAAAGLEAAGLASAVITAAIGVKAVAGYSREALNETLNPSTEAELRNIS
jgi:phosphatidylglycerophosphate synthase